MLFSTVNIGRTVASGELSAPAGAGAPWVAEFSGPILDLREHGSAAKGAGAATDNAPPSGPLWRVTLNFEQLALAPAPAPILAGFNFSGDGQGGTLLHAQAAAGSVTLNVAPVSPLRRHAHVQAPDAGLLLRTMNAYGGLENGALTLDVEYGGAASFGAGDPDRFPPGESAGFYQNYAGDHGLRSAGGGVRAWIVVRAGRGAVQPG